MANIDDDMRFGRVALEERFFSGDFDGALKLARNIREQNLELIFPVDDEFLNVRARGLVSEIFDYAGDYEFAREVIAVEGPRCEDCLDGIGPGGRGGPRGSDL